MGQVCHSAIQAPNSAPIMMWVRGRGMDMRKLPLVTYAMKTCSTATLEWLVREVGGRIDNLRWLQQHGVVLGQLGNPGELLALAAQGGHLGVVRYLHQECGIALHDDPEHGWLLHAAVDSGSVELIAWLQKSGVLLTPHAVQLACEHGDFPMLRWLLQEAHCPMEGLTVAGLTTAWARHGVREGPGAQSQLLPAVRLLRQAGCRMGARE